jgi:uncharacterized protein
VGGPQRRPGGAGVTHPATIFAIAFAATLLASMSGGSSSLVSIPAWVALGFPLPAAVGADKLAATLWAALSARNYLRGRAADRRLLASMVLAGLGGAALGTLVTTGAPAGVLRRAVGGLVVAAAVLVALRPRLGGAPGPARLGRRGAAACAVPLGFYEGMLGSGNSVLSTLVLVGGRGLAFPDALGHYYAMASAWCGLAAVSYAAQGWFEPALAVPATAGAALGGYLGSGLGRAAGARLVRPLFVAAGLVLGGLLLVRG